MKIQDQSVVTMTYVLRENDENGPILQETTKENPFVCIFGMHQLLPKFEENLMGKNLPPRPLSGARSTSFLKVYHDPRPRATAARAGRGKTGAFRESFLLFPIDIEGKSIYNI